jgi:predicted Zn-dependent protease
MLFPSNGERSRVIGLSAAVELMFGGSRGALANFGLILTELGYSRATEREADTHALQILEKAQISPQGFAGFFKRIEERERESPIGEISLLRTQQYR